MDPVMVERPAKEPEAVKERQEEQEAELHQLKAAVGELREELRAACEDMRAERDALQLQVEAKLGALEDQLAAIKKRLQEEMAGVARTPLCCQWLPSNLVETATEEMTRTRFGSIVRLRQGRQRGRQQQQRPTSLPSPLRPVNSRHTSPLSGGVRAGKTNPVRAVSDQGPEPEATGERAERDESSSMSRELVMEQLVSQMKLLDQLVAGLDKTVATRSFVSWRDNVPALELLARLLEVSIQAKRVFLESIQR
ncbi:hypothetical protein KFL_001350020 [Klebsormidium nitens]|uniref:Uncharacterized protein n=1 Tax=Klebsormidium nitens TaxID=105231 RepID=A0A1Y1I4N4_KLENI|nr:hypothetical protein KFL_001350020 [Klebsormidium nitens]|eukprot:GAQ83078.1 hypothetical protein KFL_001350020 [Klebsormidium nitens]